MNKILNQWSQLIHESLYKYDKQKLATWPSAAGAVEKLSVTRQMRDEFWEAYCAEVQVFVFLYCAKVKLL